MNTHEKLKYLSSVSQKVNFSQVNKIIRSKFDTCLIGILEILEKKICAFIYDDPQRSLMEFVRDEKLIDAENLTDECKELIRLWCQTRTEILNYGHRISRESVYELRRKV